MAVLSALLAIASLQTPLFERDSYGVPHIKANRASEAFYWAGYAVAQDRLWQMEQSRRVARAHMAEAFGADFVKSDRDTLQLAYTDQELALQVKKLSPPTQSYLESYANGVNAWIQEAKASNRLPSGYAENGFEPKPWDVLDSAAISVMLFRTFGQGGAGEVRNLALLMYLQGRPNKAKALDIFDDFLWTNDSRAPTTIAKQDENGSKIVWPQRSRKATESHLAMIPKVSLMELLPAVRIAAREEQSRIAELVSSPFKAGSYAVVVSPERSSSGMAMLLSAPQMGHRVPAIIHEMSIESPEYSAIGMDVPGAPGIAIGHTKHGAWGLTSGVADTTDIFYSKLGSGNGYVYDGKELPFETASFTLKVKGAADQPVVQKRTRFGPVIATSNSGKVVFSQKPSFWMRELESLEAMHSISNAKSVNEVESALRKATVSFNCFYALNSGDIGYRYVGVVPQRAKDVDPRLPTPGEPQFEWKGIVPFEQMPHVVNPKSGLITNWNNKPVSWWENADTPVWGRTFRVEALRSALPQGRLSLAEIELGAWWIARFEPTWLQMSEIIRTHLTKTQDGDLPRRMLQDFDGMMLNGSPSAALYKAFESALREEIFLEHTGNFMSASTFEIVAQPSVLLQALEGKTAFSYRNGRSISDLLEAALEKASQRLGSRFGDPENWSYQAGSIAVPGQPPVPYSERGSYIQLVQLAKGKPPVGRNVVNPGVAESGSHSLDQVPLARSWTYKPMLWKP